MGNTKCAFCGEELTEKNRSREHIIPNAIGGRKTVANFLCRTCNNETGRKWDTVLTKQLASLSTLLGISRSRGKIQPFEVMVSDGNARIQHPDGRLTLKNPTFNVTPDDGGISVHLHARNRDELEKMGDCLATFIDNGSAN